MTCLTTPKAFTNIFLLVNASAIISSTTFEICSTTYPIMHRLPSPIIISRIKSARVHTLVIHCPALWQGICTWPLLILSEFSPILQILLLWSATHLSADPPSCLTASSCLLSSQTFAPPPDPSPYSHPSYLPESPHQIFACTLLRCHPPTALIWSP